jgi:hypothetical protein
VFLESSLTEKKGLAPQVREIKGVAGIHMLAYKQEEAGAEILEEAGLVSRLN